MSFYCTVSKLTKKQSKKISNIQDIDLFFEERDKHYQILELGDLILKVKRKNQEK